MSYNTYDTNLLPYDQYTIIWCYAICTFPRTMLKIKGRKLDAIQKFYPAHPSFSLLLEIGLSSLLNPKLAAILPVFSCEHLFWKKNGRKTHRRQFLFSINKASFLYLMNKKQLQCVLVIFYKIPEWYCSWFLQNEIKNLKTTSFYTVALIWCRKLPSLELFQNP